MATMQKVKIGPATRTDPTLAKASLEASKILRLAVALPFAQRDAFVNATLASKYGAQTASNAFTGRAKLMKMGASRDQAVFDAMRYAITNYYLGKMVTAYQNARFSGLGDTGQDACCGITGVVTAVGGAIASIFGAGAAVNTGGAAIAGACDCSHTREQAAAAASNAQAAAETAQANVAIAQSQAQAQAAAAQAAVLQQQQKGQTLEHLALIGGGLILVLGVGWMIVR